MKPIIEIKGLGKRYDITHQRGGYIALRDVFANVFKHPFSFVTSKAKKVIGLEKKEAFWALKDISFDVMPGEVVGIIGRNGAGKSTLLKILTGITPPTEGEAVMRGRVSSLLEVGTGFHPELTGRENVFLNGAILGMTRKEIAQKFDAIVAFSGVEKFLDTPVKHYSSGMQVRLAFSVAAHMEPDILIVDEVLAVGDAEFQKKCIGKMEEVTKKDGRTILFVSHNMAAVQNVCKKTILLEKGSIKKIGETREVIGEYLQASSGVTSATSEHLAIEERGNTENLRFTDVRITDIDGSPFIQSNHRLHIAIAYESDRNEPLLDIRVLISIISERSQHMVVRLDSHGVSKTLPDSINPRGEIVCDTGAINLVEGTYLVEIAFYMQGASHGYVKTTSRFDVVTDNSVYGYTLNPDKNVCDHLVTYHFKQGL
jgi:lipopolysaccharide transport system ATP-binding protein